MCHTKLNDTIRCHARACQRMSERRVAQHSMLCRTYHKWYASTRFHLTCSATLTLTPHPGQLQGGKLGGDNTGDENWTFYQNASFFLLLRLICQLSLRHGDKWIYVQTKYVKAKYFWGKWSLKWNDLRSHSQTCVEKQFCQNCEDLNQSFGSWAKISWRGRLGGHSG